MSRTRISRILCTCLLAVVLAGCGAKDAAQNMTRSDDGATLPLPATGTDITIDLSGNAFSFVDDAGPQEKRDNTVLLYMVGSNLESEAQAASRDLLEIAESGINAGKTNVVICTGGTRGWWFDIPSDRNTIIRLDARKGLTFDAETEKLQNMGTAQTLVDFLNFSAAAYPADHYSLIFWDHGSGPIQGFCYDEVFKDILELTELQASLDASVFGDEVRLDYIGFDACLMASIEMAGLLSDYTDHLIASQETESGAGWDYSFLNAYNTTSDADAIAEAILTAYDRYFRENRTLFFNPDVTLSCMDLTRVAETEQAMDALFNAMARDLDAGSYRTLLGYREQMKSFGLAATGGRGNSLDLVDLGDLAEVMSAEYQEEAAALKTAVDALVVSQVTNVRNASGVSVYYPYNNIDLFDYYGLALYGAMNGPDGYLEYMRAYADRWSSGEEPQDLTAIYADMDTGTVTEEEITLQLTQEQIENAERFTYTIFLETSEGAYTPMVVALSCRPNDEGQIHIDADQQLYAAVTDVDERTVWPVFQLEQEDERTLFQTISAQLHNTYAFFPWGDNRNYHVTFSQSQGSDITVQSVELDATETYQGTNVSHSGKGTVDVGTWDYMAYSYFRYVPKEDDSGRTLPFTEWDTDGWGFTEFLKLDRTFRFETIDMSELPQKKYIQIIITDLDGEMHASDLLELHDEKVPTEKTVKTANGKMTFLAYDDHAELTGYEGNDRRIEIPQTVNGMQVTEIGSYVFKDNSDLETVLIPDTVTSIGESAFYKCTGLKKLSFPERLERLETYALYGCRGLEDISLPEHLQSIGTAALGDLSLSTIRIPGAVREIMPGAFMGCESLMEIETDAQTHYKSEKGVLFNADGSVLHTYPTGLAETYIIPDGTVEIGDYAFAGNEIIRQVTYPEGLREIGEFAFFDALSLTDGYDFPSSLERIGAGAFNMVSVYRSSEVGTINIGPKVSEIGVDAFADMKLRAINVAEDNPNYASINGVLTNKAKDCLLYCPTGIEGTYTIPEGIAVISDDAFSPYSGITELILPDSVLIMGGLSTPGDKITIGSGLMEWEGIRNADYTEIHIAKENTSYSAEGLIIFNGDKTELLSYPFGVENDTYSIPEGIVAIGDGAFRNLRLRVLNIPASLEHGLTRYRGASNLTMLSALEEINVEQDNPSYQSIDGILYSKDGKRLIAVPPGKRGPIIIEEGVEEISTNAINDINQSTEIRIPEGVTKLPFMLSHITASRNEDMTVDVYIPASVQEINESIFSGEVRAIQRGEESVLTLHCVGGSYAEQYFAKKGLRVVN